MTNNSKKLNQDVEIIDATYTEINWEIKIKTIRKLLEKFQTLKTLINTKIEN